MTQSTQFSAPLALGQATALAHALCAAQGARRGIRVLSIKGPAAEVHGLRPARLAADADVLVEPGGFDALCAALAERGWRERVGRETPTLLEAHSRTFIHDDWPCDIDVHRWFPGFFADPAVVFDALWKGRTALRIGSTAVAVPSRAGTAVIAAMHALRNMTVLRHQQEWEWVREALREDFTVAEREEFLTLARRGRASWVLRDIVEEIAGAAPVLDLSGDERRVWEAHVDFAADGGAAGWWIALRRLPPLAWPGFVLRAAWVPRRMIPRNDASSLPSRQESWRYQRDRWKRGLGASAKYLRRRIRSGRPRSPSGGAT